MRQRSTEDPETVQTLLAEALGTADTERAFAREMTQLRDDMTTLNKLFASVQTNLVRFDMEKLPNESGQAIAFEPRWKIIRKVRCFCFIESRSVIR